jgi:hypothetical protein
MLARPLLERLTIVKYLALAAAEEATSTAPFAAGRAVLLLQDAAEMFLRLVAEHLHATVKEQVTFNGLLEAIDKVVSSPLTHRTSLNQLNKARVNFKHFGLLPTDDDVSKLLTDVSAFLEATTRSLLQLEYEHVSLRNLVGHRRTENWLASAERHLDAGEFRDAVTDAAFAFRIAQERFRPDPQGSPLAHRRSRATPELAQLTSTIIEEFARLESRIDLLTMGIDLPQYRRFLRTAPYVSMMVAGNVQAVYSATHALQPSRQDAMFCIRFALEGALAMKRSFVPRYFPRLPDATRLIRARRESPLLVYPMKNPETIRVALPGEEFPSPDARLDQGGTCQ